jgi:uncharacterized membrane protein
VEILLKRMNESQSVVINLPAVDIFAYVSDFGNLSDWSACTITARKISPGEVQGGAVIGSTHRFLGRWMDMTFEVLEYVPDRCLTFKSISGAATCLFSYQLEPLEDAATNVTLEAVIDLTGSILDLSSSSLAQVVRRQIAHDLLTLRDVLEASAFPPGRSVV